MMIAAEAVGSRARQNQKRVDAAWHGTESRIVLEVQNAAGQLAHTSCVEIPPEPTGIDQKRLAIVYAKDKQTLAKALASDGRSWDFRSA
jgi:hypothetical protein